MGPGSNDPNKRTAHYSTFLTRNFAVRESGPGRCWAIGRVVPLTVCPYERCPLHRNNLLSTLIHDNNVHSIIINHARNIYTARQRLSIRPVIHSPNHLFTANLRRIHRRPFDSLGPSDDTRRHLMVVSATTSNAAEIRRPVSIFIHSRCHGD